MARLLHVARDIWCALRRSCRVSPPPHDATLRWIRQQGDEARESAERIRQRRLNPVSEAAFPTHPERRRP